MEHPIGCPLTNHAEEKEVFGAGAISYGIKAQRMEYRVVCILCLKENRRAPGRHYEIPLAGVGDIFASL